MDDGEAEKAALFHTPSLHFHRTPLLIPALEERSPQPAPKSLSGPPPPWCSQTSSPRQRPPPQPRRWPQLLGRPTVPLPPSQQCKNHIKKDEPASFTGLACFHALAALCSSVFSREAKATEVKPKEAQLSVERVPGTLSTASKSVQVNGAATVSINPSSPVSFCWCLSDASVTNTIIYPSLNRME